MLNMVYFLLIYIMNNNNHSDKTKINVKESC